MKALALLGIVIVGCSAKPSAVEVCGKLEAAGVARGCRADAPGGIGAAARDRAVFDLPSPAGATGQVLTFGKASDYTATVQAFDAAAVLAGRHRYGSESARVFVQMNAEASEELGAKARAVVSGL